jgi:hypothetical protein
MTIESELREIKSLLLEVNKKIDSLLKERETEIRMVHDEEALREFLEEEPDIYSIKDLKVQELIDNAPDLTDDELEQLGAKIFKGASIAKPVSEGRS